jgi:hypothetical protein
MCVAHAADPAPVVLPLGEHCPVVDPRVVEPHAFAKLRFGHFCAVAAGHHGVRIFNRAAA